MRESNGIVGISTITDPYQPIELEKELTRKGLEVLLESGRFKVSIQTKSSSVLRDIDILTKFKDRVDVGLTITTTRDDLAKIIEPRAPSASSRIHALRRLSEEGLDTWIFLGPIMRGLNDSPENIESIVDVALDTGSKIYYDFFRMKRGLVSSMKDIVRNYPSSISTDSRWRSDVSRLVERICERKGVVYEPAFPKAKSNEQKEIIDF